MQEDLASKANATNTLDILYQDEHFVAINKPHGLLVHRSKMATNTNEYAVQQLRDQLGQHVHPAHRLDRKTSGVLLFALSKSALSAIREVFENEEMTKKYWAILRGFAAPEGLIDYALTNDKGKTQEAQTAYITLDKTEIDVPFGKHTTSRYSWVEARPRTGRMHQLRKHFAHIFHPIIGDRPHGCNKQNKLFLEKWKMGTMLLHAKSLHFIHPITGKPIDIQAPAQSEFVRMVEVLKFNNELLS
ncbi:pseudouridine synthase [Reichenbachiella sp.]|uniref:pseudouridine synthase n=1 Tax=Reichenbachiella sp. TaxID=2184521 RepID=UPI003B5A03EB